MNRHQKKILKKHMQKTIAAEIACWRIANTTGPFIQGIPIEYYEHALLRSSNIEYQKEMYGRVIDPEINVSYGRNMRVYLFSKLFIDWNTCILKHNLKRPKPSQKDIANTVKYIYMLSDRLHEIHERVVSELGKEEEE